MKTSKGFLKKKKKQKPIIEAPVEPHCQLHIPVCFKHEGGFIHLTASIKQAVINAIRNCRKHCEEEKLIREYTLGTTAIIAV